MRIHSIVTALSLCAEVAGAAPPFGLDPTFGSGGVAVHDLTPEGAAVGAQGMAIVLQPDGKLVAGGHVSRGSGFRLTLARFNVDGSLDASFGEVGIARPKLTPDGGELFALLRQGDGKFVAATLFREGLTLVRFTSSGQLDTGFGDGGTSTAFIGPNVWIWPQALVEQSDGKLLVIGFTSDYQPRVALFRFDANGSPDTEFGDAGYVETSVGGHYDQAFDGVTQPDGKVIVVGTSETMIGTSGLLVRYLPNGDLDTSFGEDGVVTTDYLPDYYGGGSLAVLLEDGKLLVAGHGFNGPTGRDIAILRHLPDGDLESVTYVDFGAGDDDFPGKLVRQSDGKLVLTGSNGTSAIIARVLEDGTLDPDFASNGIATLGTGEIVMDVVVDGAAPAVIVGYGPDYLFNVLRFDEGGLLDPSFDGDGIAVLDAGGLGESFVGLIVDHSGRLVAGGSATDLTQLKGNLALLRFNPDGSIDHTFGVDGLALSGIANSVAGYALIQQSDGRLTILGGGGAGSAVARVVLGRWSEDGVLDETFGDAGIATIALPKSQATDLAQQPDGKLVVVGYREQGFDEDFFVLRYDSNGDLDPGFGVAGKVETELSGGDDRAYAVAVQADGKIVAGGRSFNGTLYAIYQMALTRYRADGSLDSDFGTGGIVETQMSSWDNIYDLLIDDAGRIVVIGSTLVEREFVLLRYLQDGSIDTSFGEAGITTGAVASSSAAPLSIVQQENGSIVAVGTTPSTGGGSDGVIIRFRSDGTLDQAFGDEGILTLGLAPQSDSINAIAAFPDDRIAVAGTTDGDYLVAQIISPLCPPSPSTCRVAGKSSVQLRNDDNDARDKLKWRWIRGAATDLTDFADPTLDTTYSLCIYAGVAPTLAGEATVAADSSSWEAGSRGYQYKDRDGRQDGVQQIVLKAGDDGKAKIICKGRGESLPDLDGPLPLPVVVQLVNHQSGPCWQAVYDADDVRRNDESAFDASAKPQ